jgi:hypothetical protein
MGIDDLDGLAFGEAGGFATAGGDGEKLGHKFKLGQFLGRTQASHVTMLPD